MTKTIRKAGRRASLLLALALVATAWLLSVLLASAARAQPAGDQPRQPPAEAIAACKTLASGAECSFSGPRGAAAGTCFAPQADLALACRPKDAPAPGGAASRPKR